jgi:heme-degrading monooxygenase HmoA
VSRIDREEPVARLATFESEPELRLDDPRRMTSLVELLRSQPGFRAGYHLCHPETGRLISLTVWETESALEAAERAVAERPASDRRGIRPTSVEKWRVGVDFSSAEAAWP